MPSSSKHNTALELSILSAFHAVYTHLQTSSLPDETTFVLHAFADALDVPPSTLHRSLTNLLSQTHSHATAQAQAANLKILRAESRRKSQSQHLWAAASGCSDVSVLLYRGPGREEEARMFAVWGDELCEMAAGRERVGKEVEKARERGRERRREANLRSLREEGREGVQVD